MSSRLKKKLGNLGVDPSSARANESFCLIGTPLPPLEKSKDNGEFVPLWKQDVRDEKGRRRLHGAFTGGFSAGYFNTVGSKEGWTPSAFVSSRGDRSKKKAARPEDFMDEEDLQELRDGRDIIDTTDEMDLAAGINAGHGDDEEQDSVARALEASMLPAAKDSAGARILKKMGWRIGQGIGPRVTLRQRKLQDLQASSGRRAAEADVVLPDDHDEASKHMYAPRDTPVLIVDRKDNPHGLGYHPGMGLNESVVGRSATAAGPKLAAGFGLGALNDADEDDLDVYDGGFAQNRNRTAYDIIDRDEEEKISIGGKTDSRSRASTMPGSSTQTFHDGKPVLAGFVLSDKPVAEDRWFPLPDIPKRWKPDPKRVWDKENAQKPEEGSSQTVPEKWSRTGISADQRGILLGETPLPSAPRSVFEFMSQKDRERLKNIASGGPPPGKATDADPASTSRPAPAPSTITIPRTEPHIALAALRGGFVPFATNPTKQARYTAYLESQAGSDTPPPPPKPTPGQNVDEFNKELEDYAKAALIFKPLSGAMAGRFTSATIVEHGPQMNEGLYTPSAEDLAKKEAELQKVEEEKISPKVHAARMGMYGPMTRETQPWQPARLLCKRFKVKDPNPPAEMPADPPPKAAYADPTSAATGTSWDQFAAPSGDGAATAGTSTTSGGRRDLSNIGLGDDEAQGRDTLTYQRPAMDLFKAIFASDDEDSDDDAKDDNDEEPPPPVQAAAQPPPAAPVPDVAMPDASEPSVESGVVDAATFKPTFIPREGKAKKESDRANDKKEKKEKKKKEKVLVSFQEDEEDGPLQISVKDRPKKKRRKDKQPNEEESMWVEKPPPDVVKQFSVPVPSEPPVLESQPSEAQVPKGRKRAIDFM
ncbi:hypothetical protein B0H19DRAFT_1113098 [Mycena capillaripes]|nr:hypothetical protein B0H19DRAFT_1113098 [Mycena capillaripes]